MNKLEKFFLFGILGSIPPLVGFLTGWWATSQIFDNWQVFLVAMLGLTAGLVVTARYIWGWVVNAYQINLAAWMVIHFFYAICVFGFFMGVPVFNIALAVPAGFFIACWLPHQRLGLEQERKIIFNTQCFTTGVLALICVTSAWLALRDSTTAANLEGMLRLNFEVTQPMIVTLILVGGAGLLAINWWLTSITIQLTTRWKQKTNRRVAGAPSSV